MSSPMTTAMCSSPRRRRSPGDTGAPGATFDGDFPNALLEGMRACELVAWGTGMEGDLTVASRAARRRNPTDSWLRCRAAGTCCRILPRLEKKDRLLVLPYSSYALACGYRQGKPRSGKALQGPSPSTRASTESGSSDRRTNRDAEGGPRSPHPRRANGENIVESVPE